MQQEGVIAVLGRRDAELEPPELVIARFQSAGPGLGRERRIRHGEIEGLEGAILVLEVGGGERVAAPQLGGGVPMQDHIHAR